MVAIGSAVAIVGRLVGIRLITAAVGATIYGEVVLLAGVATLAGSVFCSPLLQAALRFYPEAAREQRLRGFRQEFARLVGVPVVAIAVLLVVAGALWSRNISTTAGFAAAAILLAAEAARSVHFNYLNAARRHTRYATWFAFDAWARPAAAVCIVWATHPTPGAVLIGMALAAFVAAFGARTPLENDASSTPRSSRETRTALIAFGLPLLPMAVLGWITNIGDRYVLASMRGVAETGLYAAVYGLLSQPFIAAGGIVAATLRPVLFEAAAHKSAARFSRIFWTWLGAAGCIGVVGTTLAWLLSARLIQVILGQTFATAVPIAPWVAGAYALQNVQQAFEARMYAQHKTSYLLLLQAISAATALAGYFVFIPRLGMLGAAVASFAALASSCIAAIAITLTTEQSGHD